MKTTVKQLTAATLIALLISVVNVNAGEATKKHSANDSIETAQTTDDEFTNSANSGCMSNDDFYAAAENSLEVENWMTNATTWSFEFGFEDAPEAGLEVETWMTNEQTWNSNDLNFETALTLENWMTESKAWK